MGPDRMTDTEGGLWTVPDNPGNPAWRLFASYGSKRCDACRNRLDRKRGWIGDNLQSWHVSHKKRDVYRGWLHSGTATILCGLCWMNKTHLSQNILDQRAQLALEAS
jgi:hypothetical protein